MILLIVPLLFAVGGALVLYSEAERHRRRAGLYRRLLNDAEEMGVCTILGVSDDAWSHARRLLVEARRELGMSASTCAVWFEVPMDGDDVHALEDGTIEPDVATWLDWCRAMQYQPADLLNEARIAERQAREAARDAEALRGGAWGSP